MPKADEGLLLAKQRTHIVYPLRAMDEPEYLICLSCETPSYEFEYTGAKLTAVVCAACGNDDVTEFATEAEYEEMS